MHRRDNRTVLSHREMKDFLVETFGTRCWGCDFDHGDDRYLQLDHAEPKADGSSNDLDNRTLLCRPMQPGQIKPDHAGTAAQAEREGRVPYQTGGSQAR